MSEPGEVSVAPAKPAPEIPAEPEAFRRPRFVPPRRAPGKYDRAELLLFLAVLAVAAFTPAFTADGRPNAPFMQALDGQTGGGLCLLKRVTDLDCAGCGMTRAFVQLGHGNLARAALLNPLAPVIFLWILVHAFDLLLFNVRGRRLDLGIPRRWAWRMWAGFFVAFLALFAWRIASGLAGAPAT